MAFRGELDEKVADGVDTQTGLTIHSLYGDHRQPSPEQLEGLDALVFDIQDIGSRYYTYISTMGLAMEAAAEAGIAFVVLDRINPIGVWKWKALFSWERKILWVFIPFPFGTDDRRRSWLSSSRKKRTWLWIYDCSVRHWSRGCLRNHRTTLDFSFTQHAQCEGSVSVSGNRDSGNDQLSVGQYGDTPLNYWGAPTSMILCSSQLNRLHLPRVAFSPIAFTPMPACSRNNAARVSLFHHRSVGDAAGGTGGPDRTYPQEAFIRINGTPRNRLLRHPPTRDGIERGSS